MEREKHAYQDGRTRNRLIIEPLLSSEALPASPHRSTEDWILKDGSSSTLMSRQYCDASYDWIDSPLGSCEMSFQTRGVKEGEYSRTPEDLCFFQLDSLELLSQGLASLLEQLD
jgi:hypothetical protein